ncbi:MAG: hypothetical protein QXP36_03715 [Conexivisphaerales archaeon]
MSSKVDIVIKRLVKGEIDIQTACSILGVTITWLLNEMVERGYIKEALVLAKRLNIFLKIE